MSKTITHPASAVGTAHFFETLDELRSSVRWWRFTTFTLLVAWLATSLAGLATYWVLDAPVWVHSGPGIFDREPTDRDRTFVAWEAAQGILATNSATVAYDLEQARRWMTDDAVEDLNRALAEFERTNRISYEASIASQGIGTSFDELHTKVEPPIGSGASRRFPVLITGTKTTLTPRNVPLESKPFALRVFLVRVPESEGNPTGLLVSRFERLDTTEPGQVNDVPPTVRKGEETAP